MRGFTMETSFSQATNSCSSRNRVSRIFLSKDSISFIFCSKRISDFFADWNLSSFTKILDFDSAICGCAGAKDVWNAGGLDCIISSWIIDSVYFSLMILYIVIIVTGIFSFLALQNRELMNRFIMWPFAVKHNNEWWRFITSGFLHADFTHLFFNMFALLMFGFALEKRIGSRNYLIIFI